MSELLARAAEGTPTQQLQLPCLPALMFEIHFLPGSQAADGQRQGELEKGANWRPEYMSFNYGTKWPSELLILKKNLPKTKTKPSKAVLQNILLSYGRKPWEGMNSQ